MESHAIPSESQTGSHCGDHPQQFLRPWRQQTEKAEQDWILSDILSDKKASAKINERAVAEVMRMFRENDIPFVVAPFEVDWQLACLLNIGLIHVIVSTNSAFWALNDHMRLLMCLSMKNIKALIAMDKDILFNPRNRPSTKRAVGTTRFGFEAIIGATVYGNDYFPGLRGVGKKSLEPLMARYHDIAHGLFRLLVGHYPNFLPLDQQVEAIYYDAHIFQTTVCDFDEATKMTSYLFTGHIVLHRGVTHKLSSWKKGRTQLRRRRLRTWSPDPGQPIHKMLVIHDKNLDGNDLPYVWRFNFEQCRPCYQPR